MQGNGKAHAKGAAPDEKRRPCVERECNEKKVSAISCHKADASLLALITVASVIWRYLLVDKTKAVVNSYSRVCCGFPTFPTLYYHRIILQ